MTVARIVIGLIGIVSGVIISSTAVIGMRRSMRKEDRMRAQVSAQLGLGVALILLFGPFLLGLSPVIALIPAVIAILLVIWSMVILVWKRQSDSK